MPVIEREALIRRACCDPGQFVKRERTASEYGGWDYEPLHAWQARAVLAADRGAVSSWPSARNVIEAVREGQPGVDALREVVTILDIHLGQQSEPSAPWPAWADCMHPRGRS